MPADLQPEIRKHQIFYEVSPYFVLLDQRNFGSPAVKRKVQAGFDIDLYGTAVSDELSLSDGGQMRLSLDGLRQAAEAILPHPSDSCAIQIIPFETTLILDTLDHLQPQALLRIRITHCRGVDQPAGPLEALTLKDVEEKLLALGVQARGARTSHIP